jgi:hypothetical protein
VRKNESIRLFLRGSPRSFASGRRRPADPPQEHYPIKPS